MSERDDITCTQERAERLKDDALHLRTVAQLEQERSWTPVASGLSWLSRLVTTLGVHWPDSEVRAGDRWCHPGRQVVLSAAAAALRTAARICATSSESATSRSRSSFGGGAAGSSC